MNWKKNKLIPKLAKGKKIKIKVEINEDNNRKTEESTKPKSLFFGKKMKLTFRQTD